MDSKRQFIIKKPCDMKDKEDTKKNNDCSKDNMMEHKHEHKCGCNNGMKMYKDKCKVMY